MLKVRLSPSGPDYCNDVSVAIDHGSIGTKAVLEATGAVADLAQTNGLMCALTQAQYSNTGLFFSHARFDSAGQMAVGVANMTAGGVDPDSRTYPTLRTFRDARVSPGGREIGQGRAVNVNVGAIGALDTLAVDTGIAGVAGVAIVASPRAALPAGVALSHACVSGGSPTFKITLANLTGGGITPGSLIFDLFVMAGPNALGVPVRSSPSGARMLTRRNNFAVDHGSIGAASVLEASVNVPNARVGDVVVVQPRAALPAGLAVSHGRVSATGVVQVGLANLTGAPIDPASQSYDFLICGTLAKAA